jgi:hypothetical protein
MSLGGERPIRTMSLRSLFAKPAHPLLRRALPYLLVAAGSALYLYPFMRLLMHGPDEGTLIYGAERVVEGEVPFRDFFEAMGPGTFYWLALFFKLFGTTWLATRISLFLTTASTILLMYYLGRRLRTGFDAVPAVLLLGTSFGPLWPTISHHGDSTVFALLSFTALLKSLETRTPVRLFITGFLAGLTTWFLQPKGFFLFLSYLVVLWLQYRKEPKFVSSTAWLAAGYASSTGPVLLLFYAAGALPDLIYANVLWPLTRYSHANTVAYGLGAIDFYWRRWTATLVPLFSPVIGYGTSAVILVPFLALMALPIALVPLALYSRSVAFRRATVPYWIAGSALWLSEIHRKDIMHLGYGAPLFLILLFHLLRQIRSRWSAWALQFVVLSACALAGFNWFTALSARTELVTRRGVVHSFGNDPVLAFLNAHTKPNEEVFAYPYLPTNYFLAAAKNPTRFSLLIYHMHTDAQFWEAAQSLEGKKVRYILWDRGLDDDSIQWLRPLKWTFPRNERLIIEPYLSQHYSVVFELNTVRILERNNEFQ